MVFVKNNMQNVEIIKEQIPPFVKILIYIMEKNVYMRIINAKQN